ncbi:hypothetical protein EJB05_31586 [Eragrostis curvula]|uniref:Uncharacterized protein n=1 Tax=Eragrostis curvula TaxID=38414 RepID=A0A5J9UDY4_9POAL|nr:hypothetical protein EJB05_31586 [Eragrostis curvula]
MYASNLVKSISEKDIKIGEEYLQSKLLELQILFNLLALLVILVSGKILTFVQHYMSISYAQVRDFPKVRWEVQRYLMIMRGFPKGQVTLERPLLSNHLHGSLLNQVQRYYACSDVCIIEVEHFAGRLKLVRHERMHLSQDKRVGSCLFAMVCSSIQLKVFQQIQHKIRFVSIANIVYCMRTENIESVMCNGQWIMKDHKIMNINEEEVISSAGKRANDLLARAGINLPKRMDYV